MQWKHPSSPDNKKFKTQASALKVMLTIFWDVNGPVLVHFQEKGKTVNSTQYSDMLLNELKPAIQSNRRGLLSKRVLLLHDNARPHMAAHTVDTVRALKFEVLKIHSTIQSKLGAIRLSLVWTYKRKFEGQKFADDNEVTEAVQSWLKAMPKSFLLEGICKIVDRWTKCVAKQGDYVKNKTQTISISTLVNKLL